MAASRTSFCACARPLVSWAMDDSWLRMNTSRLTRAGSRRSAAAPDAMAAVSACEQRVAAAAAAVAVAVPQAVGLARSATSDHNLLLHLV